MIRTPLAALLALVMVLSASLTAGASDEPEPTAPCDAVAGATAVTLQGITEQFSGAAAADPSSVGDESLGRDSGLYDASVVTFDYVMDLAPAESVKKLDIVLDWVNAADNAVRGDYDLFVYDSNGTEVGASTNDNLVGGEGAELITLANVSHCDKLTVVAQNWAATPRDDMSLTLEPKQPQGYPAAPCASVDGAQAITFGGTSESFAGGTADPTSVGDEGVGRSTGLRAASEKAFTYQIDVPAPLTGMSKLEVTLDWTNATDNAVRGDYDLYVYNAAGEEIGVSTGDNLLGGVGAEFITLAGLGDCDVITVVAQNWAGQPGADATLSLSGRQ